MMVENKEIFNFVIGFNYHGADCFTNRYYVLYVKQLQFGFPMEKE